MCHSGRVQSHEQSGLRHGILTWFGRRDFARLLQCAAPVPNTTTRYLLLQQCTQAARWQAASAPKNTKHPVTGAKQQPVIYTEAKHPAAGRPPRIVNGTEILFCVMGGLAHNPCPGACGLTLPVQPVQGRDEAEAFRHSWMRARGASGPVHLFTSAVDARRRADNAPRCWQ
jgi:hypothetical protein